MIEIQVGKTGTARIEGRIWTSDVAPLQRMLRLLTDELFIHGGIPDADAFIVQEIGKQLPSVQVINSTPPADDEEAIESDTIEGGTD